MVSVMGYSARRPAPVDQDRMACDKGGGRRGKKHNGPGDIHGLSDLMEGGDSRDDVGTELRIGQGLLGAWSVNEGGRHSVHRDVVSSPLDGQAFREMSDSGLRHAIDGFRRERDKSGLRTHIDDSPGLLLNHHAPDRLAHKKRALQIDGKRLVEIVLADVLCEIVGSDTGVVHQNVDASKVPNGAIDGARYFIQARDIHLQRQYAPAQTFDFGGQASI